MEVFPHVMRQQRMVKVMGMLHYVTTEDGKGNGNVTLCNNRGW